MVVPPQGHGVNTTAKLTKDTQAEEEASPPEVSDLSSAHQQQHQQQHIPEQQQQEQQQRRVLEQQQNLLALQSLLVPSQPVLGPQAVRINRPLLSLHAQNSLQILQTLQQAPVITHNLIPTHLQSSSLAASLHGTPGYEPALIAPLPSLGVPASTVAAAVSTATAAAMGAGNAQQFPFVEDAIPPPALTVQDRPMTPPVYNGVNPQYPGLRVVHTSPPIFCVDGFLNSFECDFLIHVAQDAFGPAPVVGKGAGELSPSRTSSTCYLAREDLPDLMRKVSLLTGKPVDHCELPQVGRYFPNEQYLQHFDAFDLGSEDGLRFASNGGQRTITVLIYLNDVARGGATCFPALNLSVQPRKGMALVFFPATIDGLLDKMALHAAKPAIDTKFVSQVWIRQSNYGGQPSKRLPQTLGVPFGQEAALLNSINSNNTPNASSA